MKPLKNNLLVKVNQNQETTTASGFVLDVKKIEQNNGVVTHIGSEVKDVKIDDTIYFNRNSASPINIEGIEYVVIKDTDVMVIV